MAKRVAVYIRRAGSREYELASPRSLTCCLLPALHPAGKEEMGNPRR